jgi:hypothetical protein
MSNQNDPWAVAETAEAQESNGEYFGLVSVAVEFCKLVKGEGRVPFNAAQDDPNDRRTSIDIQIEPLSERATFMPRRTMVAESKEWTNIVWQSLKDLGLLSLRELNGKYAKYTNVSTGRKWTNANGETKEATTFKFLALYTTRAEAEAAKNGGNTLSAQPAAQTAPAQSDEKQIALTFLTALAKAAHGDKNKLAVQIAQYPVVSKFYTIDSPEVSKLLQTA